MNIHSLQQTLSRNILLQALILVAQHQKWAAPACLSRFIAFFGPRLARPVERQKPCNTRVLARSISLYTWRCEGSHQLHLAYNLATHSLLHAINQETRGILLARNLVTHKLWQAYCASKCRASYILWLLWQYISNTLDTLWTKNWMWQDTRTFQEGINALKSSKLMQKWWQKHVMNLFGHCHSSLSLWETLNDT